MNKERLEQMMIRHCAPTLAGLKTGNIFTVKHGYSKQMSQSLRSFNNRLKGKGVRVIPLKRNDTSVMLYVYRPQRLKCDLEGNTARCILSNQGYCSCEQNHCIAELIGRVGNCSSCQGRFPHEIGLFLGYPAEDVKGFMEEGAGACKCAGCWKVYGDQAAAEKRFQQYAKCTEVYEKCANRGVTLERLTVGWK